jgi:hypothetical protein
MRVDKGFNAERVLAAVLDLPEKRYGSGRGDALFLSHLVDEVRALPSVASAAARRVTSLACACAQEATTTIP